ncbi:hypothetical protein HKD37_03G006282 [Glycine soja]
MAFFCWVLLTSVAILFFYIQVWNYDFVLLFPGLYLVPFGLYVGFHVLKAFTFVWNCDFVVLIPAMSWKENLISELHTRKGTWKIVVRITDLWQVRKQNSKQAIEMVLMDQTGSKIGATLLQELFTELRDKLHCSSSYLIQNLRIVDNQSEYRVSPVPLLVYFLKTTSVKEIQHPEIPSNIYLITPFGDIISGVAPRHTLVDIVGVVADLIDVKIDNPPHRMTIRLRDNSNCEILMTLHDAIDKNLLLQEPFVVMLTLGKIKDAIDKYPLNVQNVKFGSRLYVNTDIAEIQQFRQSLCVPFYCGGITHDKGGSQSQSSQSNLVEKFLHNAGVVSIGEINNLRQDCYCLTVGTVEEIIIDAPWSYDSCPNCTTTFDPSKGGSACCSCQNSVTDTVPWMEHNGDKGNFLFWDATCIKLFGKTAAECRDELIAEESSKGKAIVVEPESSPPIFHPTPSLSQSADYDLGNSTCLTPTKRISCQQTKYSLNDPTIDDLDDYDEQTILTASSTYQNTSGAYIDIGDLVWECPHCKAMMWYDQQPPHPLNYLLFNNHDPTTKNFQQHIRTYNLMFTFTSPDIKIDTSYNTGKGPPTFCIHGQTHHLIGSLLPMPNNPPKFAQLYIYDTDNEINNRLSQNSSDDKGQIAIAALPDLKIKLISQRQTDERLYNLPTTTKVGPLIVGDEHSADKRDIIIEKQSGLLKRIHELHPAYLPLQYPLLYPKGEDGYRVDIPHKDHANIHTAKRKKVTLREYFCYRLQSRTNEAQTILHSRRLFQQWIVDGYCMIESQKLNYVRQHQQQLRVDKYINLSASNDHPETLGRDKGKRIILPSSFVGSQRYMEQLYFDGMTICGHLGFPDLFLTITCNPTWPEIQRKVTQSNLTPHNCPDIITRVFKIKLNQLMNDLKHVIYTIEWQKRGLSHAHILIFLHPSNKLPNPEDIDHIISAEVPNKHTHAELFEIVSSHMMHGPCIQLTEKETIHLCLTDIENMLQANRKSFDMTNKCSQQNSIEYTICSQQKTIVDTIIRVVNTQSAAVYFLYGYGGTGKTFVWATLSFAIRSNGGIGQSLQHVGLYLPHPVFSHGQLYVALSRVKSKYGLHILIQDNDGNPKNITTNVVYNENVLQVPFSYHRQCIRKYPKYVLFHFDGNKHFIRVRTHGSRCFFADGLKEFRTTHNLNESVILRFVSFDKNTTFSVDVVGPTHRQSRWHITIHNDVPAIANPWFNFIHENKMIPGDEVVFYYRFDEHAWEVLIIKDIEWDNKEINFDN